MLNTVWLPNLDPGLPAPAGNLGNRPLEWIISGQITAPAGPVHLVFRLEGYIEAINTWFQASAEIWHLAVPAQAGLAHAFTYQMVTGGGAADLPFYSRMRVRAFVNPGGGASQATVNFIRATYRQLRF